jgi:uncharacterized protein (TIGR02099 family)
MRAATRNIIRKIWHAGWIFVASFLILLALLFSGIRLMLPLATDYKNDIENLVTGLSGYPARIARIDTDWHWFKPRLKLIGVRLEDGATGSELFAAQEIIVAINPFSSLVNRRVEIDDLAVVRTHFSLRRDEAGKLYAQGFALPIRVEQDTTGTGLSLPPFLNNRTLRVVDSVVAFADDRNNMDYSLEAVNLAVQSGEDNHRAYLSVNLPAEIGERFEVGLELRGDLRSLESIEGRIYARAAALELPAVLQKTSYRDSVKSGRLDFALWAELDSKARREMQGYINLRDLAGDFAGVPVLSGLQPPFDRLFADFQARLSGPELELELENLLLARGDNAAPVNGLGVKTSIDGQSMFTRGEIMIDYLRLQDVWSIAAHHPRVQEALQQAGIETVGGNILEFYGKWDLTRADSRNIELATRFEELSITGSAQTPGVSALRGSARARNNTAVVDFETVDSEFNYPRLFRNKLVLRSLNGSILARYSDNAFTLATRNLFLQTPHMVSRHWFDLRFLKGHAPYLDAYATFEDGDVTAAAEYYPVTIMSENLVSWLDAAVIAGRLTAGDFELRGPLDKYPFRNNEGIFRVDADFDGMELDYFKGWTHLKDARLHTRFIGATLAITVHEGKIGGIDIIGADTWITDFKKARLIAQAPVYGPLGGVVDYLRGNSGLKEHFGPLIDRVEADGMQAGFLRLDIPLYQGADTRWHYAASIFKGSLAFPEAGLKFTDINSDIRLSREHIHAAPFAVGLNGHPLEAAVTTYAEDGGNTARIALTGEIAPADFLPRASFDPAAYLTGTAPVSVAIDLPLTGTAARRDAVIGLQLDASATAIDLPAPFAKPAGVAADLSVYTQFKDRGLLIDIDYAGWLDGKVQFKPDKQGLMLERADIRLDDGEPRLPEATGIFVTGRVKELNIDQWLALRTADGFAAGNPLQRIVLKARQLTYLQRTLKEVTLQLTQQPQHWLAELRSELLTGSVGIPKQGLAVAGLDLDLEYFNFDRLFGDSPTAADRFVSEQLAPGDIPPLRVQADRIILNGWDLQQVELRADVDGQTLGGTLKIGDPDVGLQGTAEWSVDRKGMHRTEISLGFNSHNVGRGMGKFGYAEIIRDGTGTAQFDLDWSAPPHKPDLKTIQGEAQISLKDGAVLEIKPGGGRLFGLLSVQTIPRRLAFDFKDIFLEGFRFDKMRGRFEFAAGNAYTDNYYIDGPAGRIDITGRVGMVRRDYDQKVMFRPDLSSSLPIVGTLLGGTGTGVALIVVDRFARLFGKQTDDLARFEYTLTGSWDDPVMTPVKPRLRKKTKE